MDREEHQSGNVLSVDKDTQISVVVSNPNEGRDSIDLGRVLHNVRLKRRVFAWVVLLCVAFGICAGLLSYQISKKPLTVSSVVTLNYEIPNPLLDPEKNKKYDPSLLQDESIPLTAPVEDLSAPDGTALDLNQVTSSYVLQSALSGLELSHPITLSNLRDNILIEKILTEDSRRQQEVASSMIADKNTSAYTEVQEIQLTYDNRFVVSLRNGFGDEDSRVKYDLTGAELRLVLDRILDAFNDYLFTSYADIRLPDDTFSVIDTEELDVMESLGLLRTAVTNLYQYCDAKTDSVKSYRSWRTGRSLTDLMENLDHARSINVDYLYSYVFSNSIAKDHDAMITSFQYQLRSAQTQLDTVNDSIATVQTMLDNYKNDSIFLSMQDTDTSKTTASNTNYYNNLVKQQANNYSKAAELETTVADLQDKIDTLRANAGLAETEEIREELEDAIEVCRTAYRQISSQMEEIIASPFYTTYADHSVAQGESESFITASMKRVILGAIAGLVISCGLWFLSALLPELRITKEEELTGKEATDR